MAKINLKTELLNMAKGAREAAGAMLSLSSDAKNEVLLDMASALQENQASILKANKIDVAGASKLKKPLAFIERLTLNPARIKDMSTSLIELTKLADPVGEVLKAWRRPNGLWIHKVRVPIGVIAIIYESRPNVTSDCVGLCFKSGNSLILRGGSEALNSNLAIFNVLRGVLGRHNIPLNAINMVSTADRSAVSALLKLEGSIDLVMPRGGEGLIRQVTKMSCIPVIKHYKGICHVYVDKHANLEMAQEICFNAKVSRPGVCNAMESMLVHKDVAAGFLPAMARRFKKAGVEIRGCSVTQKIIKDSKKATLKDYRTEYLGLIVSVKVVDDLGQAVDWINNYGSHHSDTIVTDSYENALAFLKKVDSACVYVNASTRFTDGYQFGLGAEIGISTDKLHARGPMALEELTTYKYMVFGSGQIRV